MSTKPLVMRLGARPVPDGGHDEGPVQEDFLPAIVEVESGVVLAKSTRVTEVARETNDDK